MVDFRRVITALAMLALFVGLASAQVTPGGNSQLTCSTNVAVTPLLRSEGYTEQTGDITISCTGGAPLAPGATIPLINITVIYNTAVTSRLLTGSISGTAPNPNEALLLIDEPGSGLGGYGPGLAQSLCTSPLTGCPALVGNTGVTLGTAVVPNNSTNPPTPTTTPSPNVYQGTQLCPGGNCAGVNQVTFFGVPALPPATSGLRVYRITNVRVNANTLGGGSAAGGSSVVAGISISGATSLSISNATPVVGFVNSGLTASVTNATTLGQCNTQTRTAITTLSFQENFGTAFKTRVVPQSNNAFAGQLGPTPANTPPYPNPNGNQATPGAIYNSESNFVFPVGGSYAGLADFGTRLKATFNNVPPGVRIFVSTTNVQNASVPSTAPSPVGGNSITSYAALVTGETTVDGTGGTFFPAASVTDNVIGAIGATEVIPVGTSYTAVWEVLNTNPNANETLRFGVYMTYTPNINSNIPLPGDMTVSLSFAPTATSGVASNTLPIPRFTGDTAASPRRISTIGICRTILLYPFVTNQAGFDTGVTVANVSADPFGTGNQSGTCLLYLYGDKPPIGPVKFPLSGLPIGPGTVVADTLQSLAPGFQGYMFAVCNFQYAHGFAFISDVGARNIAMGYLAVVLNDPGTGARANVNTTLSENGGH